MEIKLVSDGNGRINAVPMTALEGYHARALAKWNHEHFLHGDGVRDDTEAFQALLDAMGGHDG